MLIHVVGGIAYWTAEGGVDVVLVDEDNITADDAPVLIKPEWSSVAATALGDDVFRLCNLGRRE